MSGLLASIDDTIDTFFSAVGDLFDFVSTISVLPLLAALACFAMYQLLHSRASFTALRAAYPDQPIRWRRVWGAYVTAFGLNGVVPAGGGSAVQLMLVKRSIPGSTYPGVTSALCTAGIFDGLMCAVFIGFAFTQDVFPSIGDFGDLTSFDLAWIGRHQLWTAVIAVALAALVALAIRIADKRLGSLRQDAKQGLRVLGMPRTFVRGMVVPQLVSWTFRLAAMYFLLQAFGIHATLVNAALVVSVQVFAMIVPITPGGAGVQQALLLVVFAGAASESAVTSFSVGQQIAVVVFTMIEALLAAALVFRQGSLRTLLRDSRKDEAAATASG